MFLLHFFFSAAERSRNNYLFEESLINRTNTTSPVSKQVSKINSYFYHYLKDAFIFYKML